MTDKQPEALRLANALEWPFSGPAPLKEAAAELRRLYALNQELLEALREIERYAIFEREDAWCGEIARTAIAKAQEQV